MSLGGGRSGRGTRRRREVPKGGEGTRGSRAPQSPGEETGTPLSDLGVRIANNTVWQTRITFRTRLHSQRPKNKGLLGIGPRTTLIQNSVINHLTQLTNTYFCRAFRSQSQRGQGLVFATLRN